MEVVGWIVTGIVGTLAVVFAAVGRRKAPLPPPPDETKKIEQRFRHEKLKIDEEAERKKREAEEAAEKDRLAHLEDGKKLLDDILNEKI